MAKVYSTQDKTIGLISLWKVLWRIFFWWTDHRDIDMGGKQ